jgi:hypothetical protein
MAGSRGNGSIGEEQREEREYCVQAVEGRVELCEEQRKEGLAKNRGKRGICEVQT